jgi:hypothetical protein
MGKRNLVGFIGTILLVSVLLVTSCSSSPEKPNDADEIVQDLLQAVLEGDFIKYRDYFAEHLWSQLGTEDDFTSLKSELQTIFGDYVEESMKYTGFEATEEGQLKVFYEAEFTKVTSIQVLLVCRVNEGKTVVEGFWINPK